MYLVDTNIFLEILLGQASQAKCEAFLKAEWDNVFISDFALHSIGVILFRLGKEAAFQQFCDEVLTSTQILSLPKGEYEGICDVRLKYGLDFDDAYQFSIAREYGLEIVTQDSDFNAVGRDIAVRFIT